MTPGAVLVACLYGLGIASVVVSVVAVVTVVTCAPRAWRDVAPLARRTWLVLTEVFLAVDERSTVPIYGTRALDSAARR